MIPWPTAISLVLATAALSALLTWLSIHYARRRALLDLPGQRRSHSVPTPRGGGIGIVGAALASCLFVYFRLEVGEDPLRLVVALTLVAAVGWIDDHRGLAALWRLLGHIVAVLILLLPMFSDLFHPGQSAQVSATPHSVLWLAAFFALLSAFLVWSINLHNFMDGINGLLATQAVFVYAALGMLSLTASAPHALLLFAWAAAALGFLPFNFPRARIFMGDVGSGTLGLMIGIGMFWQMTATHTAPASGLIDGSVFVTDATCTLLSRMLAGRRWYSAHREHLYQWLVRSGFSHAAVVVLYLCWNFAVVVPVLYLANRSGATAADGWIGLGAAYALAAVAWVGGKRWCLRHARRRHGAGSGH